LRGCPLAVVELLIEARTDETRTVVRRWRASARKSPIPPTICRNSCNTLQLLLNDFQRFASPLKNLGIFHARLIRAALIVAMELSVTAYKLVATAFCSRRSSTHKQTCHDAVTFSVRKIVVANVVCAMLRAVPRMWNPSVL
jgi:hypothetical protein